MKDFLNALNIYYSYTNNLPKSLKILAQSEEFKKISQDILEKLNKGLSFSKILYEKGLINSFERKILKFGEDNNLLEKALSFILDYRFLKKKIKRNLFNKVKYPFIVFLFSFSFLIFFKLKFLPEIEKIYLEMNLELHPLIKFWKIIFEVPFYFYILFSFLIFILFYKIYLIFKKHIFKRYNFILNIKLFLFLYETQGYINTAAFKSIAGESILKTSDYLKPFIQKEDYYFFKINEENNNIEEGLKYLERIYERKFLNYLENLLNFISVVVYTFSVLLVTLLILSYQLPLLFGKIE